MIINDLDGYYIVFDTKNWNTELDTLIVYTIYVSVIRSFIGMQIVVSVIHGAKIIKRK